MRNWMTLSALLAGLLVGCSDSPEHRFLLAKQMLDRNQPAEALELANSVLEEELDGENAQELREGALFVKAQAHLALGELTSSRQVLESLIDEKPQDAEPVRFMIRWAFATMEGALKKTDFLDSLELQKQFDDGYLAGMMYADKLIEKFDLIAEAEFSRARLILKKVNRANLRLEKQQTLQTRANILDDAGVDEDSQRAIQAIQDEIRGVKMDAEEKLDLVLKNDPKHSEAAALYLNLLADREAYEEIWALAVRTVDRKPVPAALAQQMAMAVLRVPDTVRKPEPRLELAESLRDAVAEAERASAPWLLTAAHIHLNKNEPEKAQALVEQVRDADPYSRFEARYLTAWCLYQRKQFERAKIILDQVATEAPKNGPVLTLYAEVLYELGEHVMSREVAQRAVDADPSYAPAHMALTKVMATSGEHKELETNWEQAYLKDPSDPLSNRMKLSHHIAKNQKGEVERQMDRLERILPRKDVHLALLIDGFGFLDRHAKVLRYAKELTERRPDQLQAHLKYAEAMVALDNIDGAEAYIDAIKDRFPEEGGTTLMMAQVFFARQQYDRVERVLGRLLQQDPNNIAARLLMARSLASRKSVEDARTHLEAIFNIDPNHKEAAALRARLELFDGDTDAAGRELAKVDETEVDPILQPALKAQILIQRNRLDEARDVCNNAVARGATDPVLRLLLARIYTLQNKPDDAELHLLALARQQPNNQEVFRLLGDFYETYTDLFNRGVNNLKDLEKVNQPLARMALSGVLLKAGKHEQALLLLNEIFPLMLEKKDDMALDVAQKIARVHLAARPAKVDDARDAYLRVENAGIRVHEAQLRQIDLSWTNPSAFNTMNRLADLAGGLQRSEETLRSQVLARLVRLDEADKKLGTIDKALEVIEAWAVKETDNATLYRWKGQILGQAGRYEDAVQAYRQAVSIEPRQLGLRVRLVAEHLTNFDFPASVRELERMGEELGDKAKALALAEMGQIYVRLGLHTQANGVFDQLERLSKSHEPRVLYAMGRALAALRQDDQARQRLALVPDYARLYPAAQVELAGIEARSGMEAQARDRIQAMIRDSRNRARTVLELVKLNARDSKEGPRHMKLLGWADEVMEFTAMPQSMHSDWMRVRIMLLDNRAATKEDFEALDKALEQWQQMEPRALPILAGRMAVLARIGREDKARQLYRSVPELATTGYGPLLAVVVNLEPRKVEERAPLPEYFVGLATGRPSMARAAVDALETRTTIYKKDLYEALERLERGDIPAKTMQAAARQLATATVALDANLPRLAESLSSNLIQHLPKFTPAHGIMAQAVLQQGKPIDDALASAMEHIPSAGVTRYLAAEKKVEQHDYRNAAAELAQLLRDEPDNVHAHYRLTQVLHLSGENDKAIANLEQLHAKGGAYRLMVSNDLAYLLAMFNPNRMEEAHGIAKRAYELVEQTRGAALGAAALRDTLGWIEHLMGDNDQAIKHLSRSIAELGGRPEVHYHIAVVYDKLNNRTWARFHMEEASRGDAKIGEVGKAKQMLAQWGR